MLTFEVLCDTRPGQMVAVMGNGPFGDWDVNRCLVLEPERYPTWVGRVDVSGDALLEFKYVLVKTNSFAAPTVVRWEADGPNRQLSPKTFGAPALVLHHTFGDFSRSSIEALSYASAPSEWSKATTGDTVMTATGSGSSPATSAGGASSLAPAPSPMAMTPLAAPPSLGSPPTSRNATTTTSTSSQPSIRRTRSRERSRSRSPEPGERVVDSLLVEPSVRFGQCYHEEGAFKERYDMQESTVLGTGMSGAVKVALNKASGAQVAVKTLSTEGLEGEKLLQAIAEVENQLLLSHPNICRLLEVFEEPGRLRLVMERMRGPDLFEHLSRTTRYTERDAAGCVRQMTSAVSYCHRNGVCHRDLKLENFCLENDEPEARVKLIDFGLSSVVEQNEPMTNACGTLYYVAPEVLRQCYDKKCDMWSLGVLTYILLDGRPPFRGRDDRATLRLIKQGAYTFPADRWSQISRQARDFVAGLLQVSVEERMDADAALAHPWLADVAREVADELAPLDGEVLDSMRSFSKSNALKRAVLRAITPVATVERVAAWADHFEALDQDGDGKVSIHALALRLVEYGGLSAVEAESLSRVLAEAEDDGDLVSYSAFLSACLTAHVNLDSSQLRSMFDRMDTNQSGTISIEKVRAALGDIVDVDSLQAELNGRELSFADFRWLMSMPGTGPSILGLRQLLGQCRSLQSTWKVALQKARKKKMNDVEALEAARRENMAWRVMEAARVRTGDLPDMGPSAPSLAAPPTPKPAQLALSLESMVVARGLRTHEQLSLMTHAEKRAVAIEDLVAKGVGAESELEGKTDDELAGLCRPRSRASSTVSELDSLPDDDVADDAPLCRTPTVMLVKSMEDPEEGWQEAATLAREGDIESARRENMNWRKMQLQLKKAVKKCKESTAPAAEA